MFSNKKNILVLSFCILFAGLPLISRAQPDPGCDPDDPLCPIDGGLSFLIAAGIGLGAKKAYSMKKKTTANY